MKTSRPAPKTSAQEECGVWLDTAQLKGKAKQVSQMWNRASSYGGMATLLPLNKAISFNNLHTADDHNTLPPAV